MVDGIKIPDEQIEKLMNEYKVYINKIINHTYRRAESGMKDELCQVGMIGLWKGIKAYYKREPKVFNQKEFVDTICAYIRYEMANLFEKLNVIKISSNQWRNYVEAKRIVAVNSNVSEEYLKCLLQEAGLRYDWYLKVKNTLSVASLDAAIDNESDTNKYSFIQCNDCNINKLIDRTYLDYIIQSAFAGVKLDRDKSLIQTWIASVYNGTELERTQLAKIYKLSSSMVGVILSRFVEICRFVRDCDKAFHSNPNGYIEFPEIKRSDTVDKKIPGVKWILRNRKWKVEISVGKYKTVFIGYFKNYGDAVSARRDAEVKYRGKSNIVI